MEDETYDTFVFTAHWNEWTVVLEPGPEDETRRDRERRAREAVTLHHYIMLSWYRWSIMGIVHASAEIN